MNADDLLLSQLSPKLQRLYKQVNESLSDNPRRPPTVEPATDEGTPAGDWPDARRGDSWEPTTEPEKPRFAFRTSAEFLRGDYHLRWLVKELLVEGQPGIVGGPKKSLKTSLLVELAYALATGTRFLGRFEADRQMRVGIMSGESGEFTLKETALRIAKARGLDAESADVLWEFELPRLADALDLIALRDAVQAAGIKVLLIDPLYLCILSGMGAAGLQASNLFHMGPLFLGMAKACLQVGCTPLLAHHFKLTRANPYDEPQLDDLAFAGVQEFARQWLLLGRRERFEPGVGMHKLWLSAGGSAGQAGLWALDINEGVMDDEFRGRKWDVMVQSAAEVREQKKEVGNASKKEKQVQQDAEDDFALLSALDRLDPGQKGVGFNQAQTEARLSDARMNRSVGRLARDGIVKEIKVQVTIGNGGLRDVRGIKKVSDDA